MTADEFRRTLKDLILSQRALAGRLGVAIPTVNRWAMGKAEVPTYAVAYLEERRELDALKAKVREALNL